MKRISFYKFLLIILISVGIYSCKDMMDKSQDYIKNGEIVYLSKIDSIVSYAGKNRVQLSGYLNNGYNVNKILVYWNNRADSMFFDYTQTKRIDSLNLIIPNLEVKSYIFDIYTVNAIGNRSIKVTISGTAYGESYSKNLLQRASNGFNFDGTRVISMWLSADPMERGTQIRYTTESSGIANVFLSPDSSQIALPNFKYDTPISFFSVYVPEKAAIDTFHTVWATLSAVYNPYVGKFHSVGTIKPPTTGIRVIDREKVITKIDNVISQVEMGDLGGTGKYMNLKVNSDFSVTITPAGGTPNIDQNYGENYYDPATKSFHLNYAFDVAAPRIISEVITRVN